MKEKIIHTLGSNTPYYFLLLIFAFMAIFNINYNSAFNDEAIYIVIGRMGLFGSDWWSYGASQWMAGLPYIYPVLTSLVYQTGGLIASRLLNVVFAILMVEEVFRFSNLLKLSDKKTVFISSLTAAFLVGFSSIGMFVGRLATYDMPSFLLLLFSINSFLKAGKHKNGKYYFLSFLTLYLSFLTKITTAFFFPPLLIFSLFIIKRRSKLHKKLAKYYFFIPFAAGIVLYTIFYSQNLLSYMASQRALGLTQDYSEIFGVIQKTSGFIILLAIPSAILIMRHKKYLKLFTLLTLAGVIPLSHLILKRLHTLDKHLLLTNIFLSVIVGYAITYFVVKYKRKFDKFLKKFKLKNNAITALHYLVILVPAFFYIKFSYDQLNQLEHQWKDSTNVEQFLMQNVSQDDKILTQSGSAIVLALYDILPLPKNAVTLDWIDYSGLTNERAYIQALEDKYFDYIELNSEESLNDNLLTEIRQRLDGNYSLVYNKNGFEVFKKNENI